MEREIKIVFFINKKTLCKSDYYKTSFLIELGLWLDTPIDTEQEKAAARDAIREEMAQEAANIIDGSSYNRKHVQTIGDFASKGESRRRGHER